MSGPAGAGEGGAGDRRASASKWGMESFTISCDYPAAIPGALAALVVASALSGGVRLALWPLVLLLVALSLALAWLVAVAPERLGLGAGARLVVAVKVFEIYFAIRDVSLDASIIRTICAYLPPPLALKAISAREMGLALLLRKRSFEFRAVRLSVRARMQEPSDWDAEAARARASALAQYLVEQHLLALLDDEGLGETPAPGRVSLLVDAVLDRAASRFDEFSFDLEADSDPQRSPPARLGLRVQRLELPPATPRPAKGRYGPLRCRDIRVGGFAVNVWPSGGDDPAVGRFVGPVHRCLVSVAAPALMADLLAGAPGPPLRRIDVRLDVFAEGGGSAVPLRPDETKLRFMWALLGRYWGAGAWIRSFQVITSAGPPPDTVALVARLRAAGKKELPAVLAEVGALPAQDQLVLRRLALRGDGAVEASPTDGSELGRRRWRDGAAKLWATGLEAYYAKHPMYHELEIQVNTDHADIAIGLQGEPDADLAPVRLRVEASTLFLRLLPHATELGCRVKSSLAVHARAPPSPGGPPLRALVPVVSQLRGGAAAAGPAAELPGDGTPHQDGGMARTRTFSTWTSSPAGTTTWDPDERPTFEVELVLPSSGPRRIQMRTFGIKLWAVPAQVIGMVQPQLLGLLNSDPVPDPPPGGPSTEETPPPPAAPPDEVQAAPPGVLGGMALQIECDMSRSGLFLPARLEDASAGAGRGQGAERDGITATAVQLNLTLESSATSEQVRLKVDGGSIVAPGGYEALALSGAPAAVGYTASMDKERNGILTTLEVQLPFTKMSVSHSVVSVGNRASQLLTEGLQSSGFIGGSPEPVDKVEEMRQKEKEQKEVLARLQEMFKGMDTDGDNMLSKDEVNNRAKRLCQGHYALTSWEFSDAFEELWATMDASNDNEVSFDELCKAVKILSAGANSEKAELAGGRDDPSQASGELPITIGELCCRLADREIGSSEKALWKHLFASGLFEDPGTTANPDWKLDTEETPAELQWKLVRALRNYELAKHWWVDEVSKRVEPGAVWEFGEGTEFLPASKALAAAFAGHLVRTTSSKLEEAPAKPTTTVSRRTTGYKISFRIAGFELGLADALAVLRGCDRLSIGAGAPPPWWRSTGPFCREHEPAVRANLLYWHEPTTGVTGMGLREADQLEAHFCLRGLHGKCLTPFGPPSFFIEDWGTDIEALSQRGKRYVEFRVLSDQHFVVNVTSSLILATKPLVETLLPASALAPDRALGAVPDGAPRTAPLDSLLAAFPELRWQEIKEHGFCHEASDGLEVGFAAPDEEELYQISLRSCTQVRRRRSSQVMQVSKTLDPGFALTRLRLPPAWELQKVRLDRSFGQRHSLSLEFLGPGGAIAGDPKVVVLVRPRKVPPPVEPLTPTRPGSPRSARGAGEPCGSPSGVSAASGSSAPRWQAQTAPSRQRAARKRELFVVNHCGKSAQLWYEETSEVRHRNRHNHERMPLPPGEEMRCTVPLKKGRFCLSLDGDPADAIRLDLTTIGRYAIPLMTRAASTEACSPGAPPLPKCLCAELSIDANGAVLLELLPQLELRNATQQPLEVRLIPPRRMSSRPPMRNSRHEVGFAGCLNITGWEGYHERLNGIYRPVMVATHNDRPVYRHKHSITGDAAHRRYLWHHDGAWRIGTEHDFSRRSGNCIAFVKSHVRDPSQIMSHKRWLQRTTEDEEARADDFTEHESEIVVSKLHGGGIAFEAVLAPGEEFQVPMTALEEPGWTVYASGAEAHAFALSGLVLKTGVEATRTRRMLGLALETQTLPYAGAAGGSGHAEWGGGTGAAREQLRRDTLLLLPGLRVVNAMPVALEVSYGGLAGDCASGATSAAVLTESFATSSRAALDRTTAGGRQAARNAVISMDSDFFKRERMQPGVALDLGGLRGGFVMRVVPAGAVDSYNRFEIEVPAEVMHDRRKFLGLSRDLSLGRFQCRLTTSWQSGAWPELVICAPCVVFNKTGLPLCARDQPQGCQAFSADAPAVLRATKHKIEVMIDTEKMAAEAASTAASGLPCHTGPLQVQLCLEATEAASSGEWQSVIASLGDGALSLHEQEGGTLLATWKLSKYTEVILADVYQSGGEEHAFRLRGPELVGSPMLRANRFEDLSEWIENLRSTVAGLAARCDDRLSVGWATEEHGACHLAPIPAVLFRGDAGVAAASDAEAGAGVRHLWARDRRHAGSSGEQGVWGEVPVQAADAGEVAIESKWPGGSGMLFLGVQVRPLIGMLARSTGVTFTPRFVVRNRSGCFMQLLPALLPPDPSRWRAPGDCVEDLGGLEGFAVWVPPGENVAISHFPWPRRPSSSFDFAGQHQGRKALALRLAGGSLLEVTSLRGQERRRVSLERVLTNFMPYRDDQGDRCCQFGPLPASLRTAGREGRLYCVRGLLRDAERLGELELNMEADIIVAAPFGAEPTWLERREGWQREQDELRVRTLGEAKVLHLHRRRVKGGGLTLGLLAPGGLVLFAQRPHSPVVAGPGGAAVGAAGAGGLPWSPWVSLDTTGDVVHGLQSAPQDGRGLSGSLAFMRCSVQVVQSTAFLVLSREQPPYRFENRSPSQTLALLFEGSSECRVLPPLSWYAFDWPDPSKSARKLVVQTLDTPDVRKRSRHEHRAPRREMYDVGVLGPGTPLDLSKEVQQISGSTAPLTEDGYFSVLKLLNPLETKAFVRRVVADLHPACSFEERGPREPAQQARWCACLTAAPPADAAAVCFGAQDQENLDAFAQRLASEGRGDRSLQGRADRSLRKMRQELILSGMVPRPKPVLSEDGCRRAALCEETAADFVRELLAAGGLAAKDEAELRTLARRHVVRPNLQRMIEELVFAPKVKEAASAEEAYERAAKDLDEVGIQLCLWRRLRETKVAASSIDGRAMAALATEVLRELRRGAEVTWQDAALRAVLLVGFKPWKVQEKVAAAASASASGAAQQTATAAAASFWRRRAAGAASAGGSSTTSFSAAMGGATASMQATSSVAAGNSMGGLGLDMTASASVAEGSGSSSPESSPTGSGSPTGAAGWAAVHGADEDAAVAMAMSGSTSVDDEASAVAAAAAALGGTAGTATAAASVVAAAGVLRTPEEELEEKMAMARSEPLTEEGYAKIAGLRSLEALAIFVERVIIEEGGEVAERDWLEEFVRVLSTERFPQQSLRKLREELMTQEWVRRTASSGTLGQLFMSRAYEGVTKVLTMSELDHRASSILWRQAGCIPDLKHWDLDVQLAGAHICFITEPRTHLLVTGGAARTSGAVFDRGEELIAITADHLHIRKELYHRKLELRLHHFQIDNLSNADRQKPIILAPVDSGYHSPGADVNKREEGGGRKASSFLYISYEQQPSNIVHISELSFIMQPVMVRLDLMFWFEFGKLVCQWIPTSRTTDGSGEDDAAITQGYVEELSRGPLPAPTTATQLMFLERLRIGAVISHLEFLMPVKSQSVFVNSGGASSEVADDDDELVQDRFSENSLWVARYLSRVSFHCHGYLRQVLLYLQDTIVWAMTTLGATVGAGLISGVGHITPKLQFPETVVMDELSDMNAFLSNLTRTYVKSGVKQWWRVFLSTNLLGDPIGLGTAVTGAFVQFVRKTGSEVYTGDIKGEGFAVLAQGVVGGVFGHAGKALGAFGDTVDALAHTGGSEGHQVTQVAHVGDGITTGLQVFVNSTASGVIGVFERPREAVQRDGVAGLGMGLLRGFAGLAAKPLSGLLHGAQHMMEGVDATTQLLGSDKNQIRPRRGARNLEAGELPALNPAQFSPHITVFIKGIRTRQLGGSTFCVRLAALDYVNGVATHVFSKTTKLGQLSAEGVVFQETKWFPTHYLLDHDLGIEVLDRSSAGDPHNPEVVYTAILERPQALEHIADLLRSPRRAERTMERWRPAHCVVKELRPHGGPSTGQQAEILLKFWPAWNPDTVPATQRWFEPPQVRGHGHHHHHHHHHGRRHAHSGAGGIAVPSAANMERALTAVPVISAARAPRLQGWLEKRSRGAFHHWASKWVVVERQEFKYWNDKSKFEANHEPKVRLQLSDPDCPFRFAADAEAGCFLQVLTTGEREARWRVPAAAVAAGTARHTAHDWLQAILRNSIEHRRAV